MSNFGRPLDFVAIPLSMRAEIWTASDANVGKALKLAMFCAEQVNGGVIRGARKWTPSEWRMRTGLRRPVTQTAPNLFAFDGDDLVVHIYNPDYEKSVLSRRKTNSNNAKNRWNSDAIASPKLNSTKLNGTEENSVVVVDTSENRRGNHPDSFDELFDYLKEKYTDLTNNQIADCAHDFMKAGEESGWSDSTGAEIRSWKAAATGFVDKWKQRIRSGGGGTAARREEKGTDTDSIDDFFTN